jgi:hypothetical protein
MNTVSDRARAFPADLDPATGDLLLLPLDVATVGELSFLGRRHLSGWEAATHVDLEQYAQSAPPLVSAPAFVFHTAFCCSTLLARALHSPPAVVALKEPNVLLRLADQVRSLPSDVLSRRTAAAVRLLGQPWHAGGRVLIKPTNVVAPLMPALLAATAGAPAILLYSSLREFLISCFKKLPAAEERMQVMAGQVLPGTGLIARLGLNQLQELGFVENCVLTWYTQIERYAQALAGSQGSRLRTLDMATLLAQPEVAVLACARWLKLDLDEATVHERVATEFARHAKSPEAEYSPDQRSAEKQLLLGHYGDVIEQALAWAGQAVRPLAQVPKDWQPLLPVAAARS